MKYLSFGAVVFASAAAISAQTPAGKTDDSITKEPVTLTGCVEAGAKPDTFVLTHVVRSDRPKDTAGLPQPSIANPTVTPPIAAPTGTSGTDAGTAAAIYSLEPPDKLKAHLGHKIAVVGTLDDDANAKSKEGDDSKVEAKEGATAAADVAAAKAGEQQPAHKVKVNSITMISSSCS